MLDPVRFALRASCAVGLVLATSPASRAADLLVVDVGGSGDFVAIQPAVDAAQDGDLILVLPGSYAGFVVANKGLTIAAPTGFVQIVGNVDVGPIADDQAIVLAELEFLQPDFDAPVLEIRTGGGEMRVTGCRFLGHGPTFTDDPRSVVAVIASSKVAFVDCEVQGGEGDDSLVAGFRGSDALSLESSTAILHDCVLQGGDGGDGEAILICGWGGAGGWGVRAIASSLLYAAGSELRGGEGGQGDGCEDGFDGYACALLTGSSAHMLDVRFDGDTFGPTTTWPYDARTLEIAPGGIGLTSAQILVHGTPGDLVTLFLAERPATLFLPDVLAGFLLVDAPFATAVFAGVIPASGVLARAIPLPKIQVGEPAHVLHVQAACRAMTGETVAANPIVVPHFNAVLDDCNANGVSDAAEIATGAGTDCNGNGILDECDLSEGTDTDCDGNGLPDHCDLYAIVAASPILSPVGAGHAPSWTLASPPPAASDVRVVLRAIADLGDQDERILVRLNGTEFGSLFSATGSDCPATPDEAALLVPAWEFNDLVVLGSATFDLEPSSTVDAFECTRPASQVEVMLEYAAAEVQRDCNANGILDSCDIAAGTSLDLDLDGVPDECP